MSKMLAVRVADRDYEQLEEVRDPARYPSQSAFVREAIRRMVRAERRKRILAEVRMLAGDAEEVALAQEYAKTGVEDWTSALDEGI
ncbi:MAG: hypothetical protein HYX94_10495 [Chloroflexi bacterium]|nr:hypothetical protein [Chloroflexota bacterium]